MSLLLDPTISNFPINLLNNIKNGNFKVYEKYQTL